MGKIFQRPVLPDVSAADATAEQNIDYSLLPRGYEWPTSRLSSQDMKRLAQMRWETKIPITRLLQDAVTLLWDTTRKERAAAAAGVSQAFKAQLEAIVMKLVEAEEAAESPETCDADLFAESRNHIGIQVSESSSSDIESHSGTKC